MHTRDTFGDRKVGDDTLARDRRDPDKFPRQHWSDFMSGQFPDAGTDAGGLLPSPGARGRVRGSTKLGG